MKKVIIGIGIGLIVLVGIVIALPFLIPASVYNNLAEEQLEAALGREVTLGTDTRITIIPNLGARIDSVEIANAEGFDDPYFAKAGSLEVAVKWLPLLSRRAELASLKFIDADIRLHQKSPEDANWIFDTAASPDEPPAEEAPASSPQFEAIIPKAEFVSSRVVYRDDVSGQTYTADPINLALKLDGLDAPASLSGDITLNDLSADIDATISSILALAEGRSVDLKTSIKSDPLDFSFDGAMVNAEDPSVTGAFTTELKDIMALVDFASVELEQDLSVLGTLTARGNVEGPVSALALSALEIEQSSGALNSNFSGDVTLSDVVQFSGSAASTIKDLSALNAAFGLGLSDDLESIGDIEFSSQLAGTPEDLKAEEIDLVLKGANLNASYTGGVALKGQDLSANGNLKAASNSLRRLLTQLGVSIEAPSDDAYRSFDADLAITQNGQFTTAKINTLKFDELVIDGEAGVDLSSTVPRVNVNIALPRADISPYLAESEGKKPATQANQGWSKDPIDFTAVSAINGDVKVYVGELTDGKAVVRDLRLNGNFDNGRFQGQLNTTQPEGGRTNQSNLIDPFRDGELDVTFALNASNPETPTLGLETQGSGIAAAALLKFITGMSVLEGVGALEADIETNGVSLDAMVRNLSGTYDAEVLEGAIFGVNLSQLVRSAKDALLTGQLPAALSPEQKTDFSSLALKGPINRGIATVELFQLNAPYVRANASGTIDLYNQTMDLRLLPKVVQTENAQDEDPGINGFGIPLKVFGSWASLNGSLDMDFIADLAKQEAAARLTDEVKSRLGGDVGSILDSALKLPGSGTQSNDSAEADTSNPDESETSETAEEASEQDSAEDAAKSILLDLLGNRN